MDELQGQYGKWSKLDTEEQILHNPPYIRNLKYSNS
jgi:hypothetical protein